jgi:hypothetical protein
MGDLAEVEYTPNCRCKRGELRTYLDHNNPIEGRLVVDHEPVMRAEDHEEGNCWTGGLCVERKWLGKDGKERSDFVLFDFSEVKRVRDAMNAFLFDHTP